MIKISGGYWLISLQQYVVNIISCPGGYNNIPSLRKLYHKNIRRGSPHAMHAFMRGFNITGIGRHYVYSHSQQIAYLIYTNYYIEGKSLSQEEYEKHLLIEKLSGLSRCSKRL